MSAYRPQFAFAVPRGYRDETFHYSFDATTNPALGRAVPAGGAALNNVLQTQNDAPFVVRAVKVTGSSLAVPPASTLQLQVKDAAGNLLSARSIPLSCYLTPAGVVVVGSLPVPIEPGLHIPASGFLQVDLVDVSGLGSDVPVHFTLLGVKRYKQECAA